MATLKVKIVRVLMSGAIVALIFAFGEVLEPPLDVVAIFAEALILFALALVTENKQRRRAGGARARCACGYDLRATPHRCPECGRLVERRRWINAVDG